MAGTSLAFVCTIEGHPLSVVTADCFAEETIQMMRALGGEVEGVAVGFKPPHLDDAPDNAVIAIPEAAARLMARRMAAREGLFAGTSTCMNIAAAQTIAAERPEEATVVTIAVDTGHKNLQGDLYRKSATG